MNEAREIAAKLSEAQVATLCDLCSCPGLFAGQYEDLDRLPFLLVRRSYRGVAGFMGLAKAEPSQLGLQVRAILNPETSHHG